MPDTLTPEARVVLPGSEQQPVPDTKRFGPRMGPPEAIDPTKQKTVTVYLKRMSQEAMSALTVLASENHLTLRADTSGSAIQLTGRLGDLWDTFADKTTGRMYHSVRENMEHDARIGSLSIPASLARVVSEPGQPLAEGDISVLGLDDRPIASPRYTKRADVSSDKLFLEARASGAVPLFARQVARAYGIPANCGDGSGVVMGIISLGGGYKAGNLSSFCSRPEVNCTVPSLEWLAVDGGGNKPGNDADTENALDICIMVDILAYAFGPNHKAKILVAGAPNTDAGFANGISTLIQRGATNIGCSWGSAEQQWMSQARTVMRNIVSGNKCRIFPASGDDGDLDGQRSYAVDFLASMPESYAVGGTQLILNADGSRFREKVWGGDPGGGAGGGGLSQIYPRPDYQAQWPLSRGGQFWHGVPDFSGNADPASGYLIYQDGLISVGGTSGSAPLYATCFGILDYLGIHLDHQSLYAHPEWFYDITVGNNSPRFPAGPSYDVASGLGVLDFGKVIATYKPPVMMPPPVLLPPINNPPPVKPILDKKQQSVKDIMDALGYKTTSPAKGGEDLGISK